MSSLLLDTFPTGDLSTTTNFDSFLNKPGSVFSIPEENLIEDPGSNSMITFKMDLCNIMTESAVCPLNRTTMQDDLVVTQSTYSYFIHCGNSTVDSVIIVDNLHLDS